MPSSFMISAMHIVADLDTPTLQWTRVATPASLPFPVELRISFVPGKRYQTTH